MDLRKLLLLWFIIIGGIVTSASAASVKVRLTGVENGDEITLSIASAEYIATLSAAYDGEYIFDNVPVGRHSVKAEGAGYNVIEALTVIVGSDGSVQPSEPLRVAVTRQSDNPDEWNFSWREDDSPAGYTTTSSINKPVEIEFLGKKIVPSDAPSAAELHKRYNVILSDEDEAWTQEYAYRLSETFKTLVYSFEMLPAKFTLTSSHINDDITVTSVGEGCEVKISKDAFAYANPFLVNLDGVRGRLFSKRLHHALANYVTNFGRDDNRVDAILRERFGCRVLGVDYEELTRGITDEDAGRFQPFAPSELVSIINMFEEMPEGFHKVQHLNYLIRRQDGMKHPLYPEAAAVAWPVDNGYIEFMQTSFGGNNQNFETLRLILHEKTHFLWAFTFSDEIKSEWIKIGGWYEDPNAAEGWSTTKDTEFVSAYAHAKNPNEDMAESVAFYLKDPEKLMSRSPEKYQFICDRIMHGTRYISSIPDHLTFEVLNLWPDYDYPGKIKAVNVTVAGAPEEDKTLTLEVELNHMDGYNDEASVGFTRITSPTFIDENGKKHDQFIDVWLDPVDGNGHRLRGTGKISKYAKAGHWVAGDINIRDLNGNERHEGRNDCVTDFYVNNPLEDLLPPKYVSGSLEYALSDDVNDGHQCQNLKITYKVTDNIGIKTTFARIYCDSPNFNTGGTGVTDHYGTYDPETQTAEVNVTIPEYFPTADYYVPFVFFGDFAGTSVQVDFTDSPLDEPRKKIHITTPDPDTKAPEIDLNRITVYAEPTHPEAPDGETKVTVHFYVRDDNSGFGPCYYHFRDPQGVMHGDWFYHRNSGTKYFEGDPTVWEHYIINHILPRGSVPGIWGLGQLEVGDKAGNQYTYNFVETLIFEPDDSESDYELFSEIDSEDIVTIDVLGSSGMEYGFNWRIIHEESGREIAGSTTDAAHPSRAINNKTQVDVSTFDKGDLVVIVNILDADGKTVAVKTSRLEKSTSGIEMTVSDKPLMVDVESGDIVVRGALGVVEVFNVSGVRVATSITGRVSGLSKDIYIVRCGDRVAKIRL